MFSIYIFLKQQKITWIFSTLPEKKESCQLFQQVQVYNSTIGQMQTLQQKLYFHNLSDIWMYSINNLVFPKVAHADNSVSFQWRIALENGRSGSVRELWRKKNTLILAR